VDEARHVLDAVAGTSSSSRALRSFFFGGANLPRSSTREGGLEEFPKFRDIRCPSLASLPDRTSLASISSEICPAWRRTTTISSSRDISSSTGTGKSHLTPTDHAAIDTPRSPTATPPAGQPTRRDDWG
jgi:hypothetical protein